MALTPNLDPKNKQTSALPIGSRVLLDPWNDQVELTNEKPAPLHSPGEKIPFEAIPLTPFLTRYSSSVSHEPAMNLDHPR